MTLKNRLLACLLHLLFIGRFPLAEGQETSSGVDQALLRLGSSDPKVSGAGFYDLLRSGLAPGNALPGSLHRVLRAYPARADQIKLGLIHALENANSYKAREESRGGILDAEFSDYWPDLIWAVGLLRDPRSVGALMGALGTGQMATDFLADLAPASVDALVGESRSNRRSPALIVLGECLTRQAVMRAYPEAARKVRRARQLKARTGSRGSGRQTDLPWFTTILKFMPSSSESLGKTLTVALTERTREANLVFSYAKRPRMLCLVSGAESRKTICRT